ncbi:MAG: BadF/BadG/BcrA/BcrD ATPase family protein [Elusimicrobiota bacterium]
MTPLPIKAESLGLDLGGTRLRACLAYEDGRLSRTKVLAAPLPSALAQEISGLKARWNISGLERLVIGSAGAWAKPNRRRLEKSLSGLARRITVLADVELAYEAALAGRPGILIIAGTGSIALGIGQDGRRARAGGWGALLGDEGSAFWIGREALKRGIKGKFPHPLTLAHSPNPVRRTAALAERVLAMAGQSRAARDIVNEAAAHLAGLALHVKSKIELRGKIQTSWTGGLFESPVFFAAVQKALRRASPRFDLIAPLTTPERAAALFKTFPRNARMRRN